MLADEKFSASPNPKGQAESFADPAACETMSREDIDLEDKGAELAAFERSKHTDEDAPVGSKNDLFPLREINVGKGLIRCNPPVLILGMALLWGVSLWCVSDPEEAASNLYKWKGWVSAYFGWLYILSQNVWLIFFAWVYFKYGNKKLGKKDDEPEFSNSAYFMMIFSAGIGTGLFFYGVGEPLYHATATYGTSRYEALSYLSQDEKDQWAINITLFHWGFLGWVTYSLLACAMAIMAYRHDLPLSLRSTLYPLLGRHTFGWIGDLIDGFSVVTIIAGVVTDLGLGADQIVLGLQRVNIVKAACVDETDSDCLDSDGLLTARLSVVWVITAIAGLSAITGVQRGIKWLSQIGFILGTLIWAAVLLADRTEFILNLLVQSVGFHIQWFFQIGWATDAWAQLSETPGSGRAQDGQSASQGWMNSWTIFYWGWWIAWAPFVGMFLARISRGRTIASVVQFTMTVPFTYIILWFAVYGGAGIRMQRRAEEIMARNDSATFLREDTASKCYNVPADYADAHISPVCLYEGNSGMAWFDLMSQYGDIANALNVFSVIAMIIYFVTSSDSGSLVVDSLIANGKEDHYPFQRLFWAVTQGAVASALLYAGGTDIVYGYQAMLVIVGFPYTIIFCLICAALYKVLEQDELYVKHGIEWHSEAIDDTANHFAYPIYGGVLDVFELVLSLGKSRPDRGFKFVTAKNALELVLSFVFPFVSYFRISSKLGKPLLETIVASIACLGFFASTVALLLTNATSDEYSFYGVVGTVLYFAFAATVGNLRYTFRKEFNIYHGNVLEDFFSSLFLYPQVFAQMLHHLEVVDPQSVKSE